MSTPGRSWFPAPDGGLVLELSVMVNGERLCVRNTVAERGMRACASVPFQYVEREMRRQLMREVEYRLLGPEPR